MSLHRTTGFCLLVVGCSSAPSANKSTETPTVPGDSATEAVDSGPSTDSGSAPVSPCSGRGTVVSALNADGCVSEAACVWEGELSYLYLGYAVAGGRDFDGDGVEDVVFGAPYGDAVVDSATVYDVGMVHVVSGAELTSGQPGVVATMFGLTESEQAGSSVALVGDLDGDGASELLVGARNYSEVGAPSMGAVHLILGGPGSTDTSATPARTWIGSQTYGRSGHALTTPGDMDGDGIPELAIGGDLWDAEGAEAVEVFSSGKVFLASGAELPESGRLSTFPTVLVGDGPLDQAGSALAGGDLDGDGYAELVVGVPYGASSRGGVSVVAGGADSLTAGTFALADRTHLSLEGRGGGDAFGWSVAVGDVTGDGRPELVVGAPLHDAPWGAEGEATIWTLGDEPELLARRTGEADDHQLGTGLAAGRDLDGDGIGDVVVGAVAAWHGLRPKSGRTYILAGGPTLTGDQPIAGGHQVHATGAKDYLGRSTALSDLDADGTADLILGSAYVNPGGRYDAGGVWVFFGG
jgi:hypothetical protein